MNVIEIHDSGTYLVLKVMTDEFALHEVTKTSSKTIAHIQRLNYPNTIIDLIGVQYIDTSGIGYMANMKNLLKNHNSELVIVCNNESILDIMRIIKLNTFVKIFATVDAAESYMKGKAKQS